ncbi:MAG TPA: hypothetical protein VHE55_03475 [Fimbriimonadaceae bacterium]|nr:hypothetical protein [Fimbriimonadaceae bacterium]
MTEGGAQPVRAGSANPAEELDEQRLATATQGLRKANGFIVVAKPQAPNAKAGESLRQKAEAVTEQRNTWFVSVAAFRDAILADPNNAKSYEGLARAFLMEGMTNEAEPALATALKIDPKFGKARYELGIVKQMDSDYAGAVAEWKTLTQTDPGYGDVYARMAIASYYIHDYPSAWQYLATADKRHQNVPPQFRDLLKEADPQK